MSLNTENAILSNAIKVDSSYNVGIGGAPIAAYKVDVTGAFKSSAAGYFGGATAASGLAGASELIVQNEIGIQNTDTTGPYLRMVIGAVNQNITFVTGAFSGTEPNLLFNVGGSTRLTISASTGGAIFSGPFLEMSGSGLSAPPAALNYGLFPQSSIGLGLSSLYGMTFWTGTTPAERIRIGSDGTKYFGVYNGSRFQMSASGENFYQYTNSYYIYGMYNSSNNLAIESAFAGDIEFKAQNQTISSIPQTATIRATIKGNTGNFLIGTTSDNGSRLQVAGNSTFTNGRQILAVTGDSRNGILSTNGNPIESYYVYSGSVAAGATISMTINQILYEFMSSYIFDIVGLYAPSGVNVRSFLTGIAHFFSDGSTNDNNVASLTGTGWSVSSNSNNSGTFNIVFTNTSGSTMSNVNIRALKLNRMN